ncbi:tRNA pseudouridine(55) synthase TruB [Treponema sp.]|uniref:tRNA pseudouridine(55) synthase TruB n=1 Tax=Treponema sp. TaxID=166 RepID=UPI003EFF12E7
MPARKSRNSTSGIVLYAKTPGITSFSSLWSIKHALNTEKVGHTGTLDSFAEGLLVVLSGSLTHLVSHVTSFTKTYQAVVCFGKETDTLDPTGAVVKNGDAATREDIEQALKSFTGAILQVPPIYSALHVDGKRASDLVRGGNEIRLESRQVFVYKNQLLDFKAPTQDDGCSYALLEIVCSKGTYIRALARDIAASIGTCAHLCALRRTKVGPFELKDAACFSELKEFSIENGIQNALFFQRQRGKIHLKLEKKFKKRQEDSVEKLRGIRDHFLLFSKDMASLCGFSCDVLKPEFEKSYLNGRPLSQKMFAIESTGNVENEIAVFYSTGKFAGIICKNKDARLSYGFVVPPEKNEFKVFSWDGICALDFPVEWKARGCALTVGGFETVHAGHVQLIKTAVSHSCLVPGAVTFSSRIKQDDGGAVFTLEQRLEFFRELGLAFAVVVDFTPEFSKISGSDFIDTLVSSCGMKVLVEGGDFKCGRGGLLGMDGLFEIAREKDFELCRKDDVSLGGEKISTSRIRSEILAGNFALVQKMLLRPFSMDVRGICFREISSGSESSVFEFCNEKNQLLPKDGIYTVAAVTLEEQIFHTSLEIKNGFLNISLPSLSVAEKMCRLTFC